MVYIKQVEKPPDFSRIEVMESQKLPFEITPQIKRYLEDILFLYRECFPESIASFQPDKVFFLVEKEITGEIKTPRQYAIQRVFWQYLREQKVVKIIFVLRTCNIQNLMVEAEPFFRNSKGEIYTGLRPSVIAVGRIREEPDKPIKRFFAYYKNLQQVLERLQKHARHKHVVFKLFDIKPIEELLERIKSSEENIQHSKEVGERGVQSIKLPPNTRWQDITIRFLDKDNVEITTKDFARTANFKEMGFEDKKTKRPNVQWNFLQLLATPYFNGELSWDRLTKRMGEKPEEFKVFSQKEIWNFKKKKQFLIKNLRDYFRISEDPFYSFRKEGAYRIKIKLVSSVDQLDSIDSGEKDDIDSEVKEHFDKNAPSIYEKPNKYDDNY